MTPPTAPSPLRGHLAPAAWVGLCAAGLVVASLAELGWPGDPGRLWPWVLLVGSATCFVYLFDRIAGTSPEDEPTPGPWPRDDVLVAGIWFGVCALGALWGLVALSSWKAWWALFPMACVTFGYTLPLLPGRKRLKDLPGVKIFLIAAVWTLATCVMPIWWVTGAAGPPEIVGMRLAFILAITLPFDLRDQHKDRRHGIHTLPHLLGSEGCKALALGLLATLVGLAWWSEAVAPRSFLAIATITAFNAAIVASWSPQRGRLYYVFWCEGTMGFYAITLALANASSLASSIIS